MKKHLVQLFQLGLLKNEDDLINKIHKTGYGLSSSIFSNNKKELIELLVD